MQTLRARVRPLFYTRLRLGEFDPPAMNPYSALDLSVVQSPEHRNLSLEAAVKSFVLLKNQRDTLPLRARDLPGKRLAVSTTRRSRAASSMPPAVPVFGEPRATWRGAAGARPHPPLPPAGGGPLRGQSPGAFWGLCASAGAAVHLHAPVSPRCWTPLGLALPFPGAGGHRPCCPLTPPSPGAGGGCRCCRPTSALRRGAGSRGASSTRGQRWRMRCGEPTWCWCAWGQVRGERRAGALPLGHTHVGTGCKGLSLGSRCRDRCGDGGEGPEGPGAARPPAGAAAGRRAGR